MWCCGWWHWLFAPHTSASLEDFFIDEFVVLESEPGEAMLGFFFERIVEIDPIVLREFGVEADSK